MTPTEPTSPQVALLIAGGPLGNCVANHLARRFPTLAIIREEPERKLHILRRRARREGWTTAIGQAAFGLVYKLGERMHEHRRHQVLSDAGLSPTLRSDLCINRVPSVNSDDCEALLKNFRPDVVAVYGTRLIKPELLQQVPALFLNYHAGITPKYRGQHAAYWALVRNEAHNAGVTIHNVDTGVDTGRVLYQAQIQFSKSDNIWTYQWVQLCAALPRFEEVILRALDGKLQPIVTALPSELHLPPTLWTYIWNGLTKGVW